MDGHRAILAIDGGGIRGVIAAEVLKSLESRLTKPIHECFDLVIGTSTGALMAAGLTIPGKSGRPATAAELLELYVKKGQEIFPDDVFSDLRRSVTKYTGPQYDPEPLEKIIKSVLGSKATLKDALTRLVITAYDIDERHAVFMSNVVDSETDYLAWEAVRGSTAAPTYFPPALVKPIGANLPRPLVDGGVFANDPAMAGYVEVQKLRRDGHWEQGGTTVVSVGTGQAIRSYPYSEAKNWGLLGWIDPSRANPIVSILMQGQASTTAYQLNSILNGRCGRIRPDVLSTEPAASSAWSDLSYFRLDARLSRPANDEMDDASENNIKALRDVGARIAATNAGALDAIAARLCKPVPAPADG